MSSTNSDKNFCEANGLKNDFFASGNSLQSSGLHLTQLFETLYGWEPAYHNDTFLGLNLIWPGFDLDPTKQRYFLSWHTEYIDVAWLIKQAQRVYPRSVLVATDFDIVLNPQWPDNIEFVRVCTWHQQIEKIINTYGYCHRPKQPQYLFSSLSFRYSQYKKLVTAWLLRHQSHKDIVLTWHGQLLKSQDQHATPGFEHYDMPTQGVFINWQDDFDMSKNNPLDNSNWQTLPYINALVNLTNESFHYSLSQQQDSAFFNPAPYITEKTFKPLLAARPFVVVGQAGTLKTLSDLGINTDFGWNNDYDLDPGDLTRIQKIFDTLEQIGKQSIQDLYEQTLPTVLSNIEHLTSGQFAEHCRRVNQPGLHRIRDFIKPLANVV